MHFQMSGKAAKMDLVVLMRRTTSGLMLPSAEATLPFLAIPSDDL